MITGEDIKLTLDCLEFARQKGASSARITLTKSTEDLVATLDGAVDRVTRCEDRSMNISLFVDGRFGSFSINKLERTAVEDFIVRAVDMVRMLAPDGFRKLTDPALQCTDAISGNELDTYDPACSEITPEQRVRLALGLSITGSKDLEGLPYDVISEEGEYSDSLYDVFVADTQGLRCRHTETNFDYGVEVTIEDREGNKYSDYWWESSSRFSSLDASDCGRVAVRRAAAQIGSKPVCSGKYNMVVATEAASKMVSPLLRALNAYSIQQGNSFLSDSLGRKIFPEGMTLMDCPHRKGESGSKLFDSEGTATSEVPIIEKGVVKQYFINSYMSGKMGMPQTVEDATRPVLMPWPEPGLDQEELMRRVGNGILVKEFNGGNSNSATGDFSFGITGELFKDGKVAGPVNEMLVTGNFIDLWSHLTAVADDCRPCMSKLIPTLAFSNVDFNG